MDFEKNCKICPLNNENTYVPPEIDEGIKILFVGEAPGANEVKEGRPFCGDAGQILRAALQELDLRGIKYGVTNAVKCRPPANRKPTKVEIEACMDRLVAEIEALQPELIVCLGEVALKAITGNGKGILKKNGTILWDYPIPVLVCVHPSYVLHTGKNNLAVFEQGILPALHFFDKATEVNYKVVKKFPKVKECAMDLETSDIDVNKGRLKSIAITSDKGTYFMKWPGNSDKNLRKFLETTPLICHHAQFEHRWLIHHGINANIVEDTRLLAYLIDESQPTDLESLCLKYEIDRPYKIGDAVVDLEGKDLEERNCRDTINTFKLKDTLLSLVSEEEYKVYKEVLLPATKSLAQIELAGLHVDLDTMDKIEAELKEKIDEIDLMNDPYIKEVEKITGRSFKIKSSIQRKILVYDVLGYEYSNQAKTKTGNPSTQAEVLEKFLAQRHTDTLEKLIRYSEYTGWLKNFIEVMKKNLVGEFVYTSLWLGGTATGRIKSSDPNMQNVPKSFVRRIFNSRYTGGVLIDADHSQMELRILAGLSQDEALIDGLLSEDLHTETAKVIFNKKDISEKERALGKRINFAIPTGASDARIAFETGLPLPEVKMLLRRYWRRHWRLKEYFEELPKSGIVKSPTGMKRNCQTPNQARNFAIQNCALIIHLRTINEWVPFMREWRGTAVLPIHDSFLSDVPLNPEDKKFKRFCRELKEVLESQTFDWMPVPILCDIKWGYNWYDMKEVEL